jgi:predicted nucleotidyltransferase
MDVIGIICEYNPFHNGHLYHINKIKEMYPNSLIVLVLNGYFLERGEISILTKEDKVKISLDNNIDIIAELPFVFGSQSADTFAEAAVIILNYLGVQKLVFGSECNDIDLLTSIASKELKENLNQKIKENLKEGCNYPTALNKSLGININTPNDLLGISYIKAIIKNKLKIKPITIKRTGKLKIILM